MLKINRRADYAVRVLVALAKKPEGARLSSADIQTEMLIPRPFLQRIIADLSRAQLVQTQPGPNGGLRLGRPKNEISLRDIYEPIEGPLLISDCLIGPGECPLDSGCPVRPRWARLQNMVVKELESINLQELYEDAQRIAALNAMTVARRPLDPCILKS